MSKSKANLENNQETKHGGARKGAGRKSGAATVKTRAIANAVLAGDELTPLEYMLEVMRTKPSDDLEPREYLAAVNLRFEAAKAAAPYIHPKLSAIEHTGANGGAIETITRIELVDMDGGSQN
jgi:hypothetical protein